MAGINPMLSVIGLYNWDDTMFDGLTVPDGMDHDNVVKNLLMDLAELQVIYPDPDFMKMAIKEWSASMQLQWKKLYDAMHIEYNPLWNKDGLYNEKETRDLHGVGSSESVGKVSAYNNEDFVNQQKSNTSGQTADTGTITRERRETGNIGLTTSQEMLTQEVNLWSNLNMTKIIINDFKKRFCIMVY